MDLHPFEEKQPSIFYEKQATRLGQKETTHQNSHLRSLHKGGKTMCYPKKNQRGGEPTFSKPESVR